MGVFRFYGVLTMGIDAEIKHNMARAFFASAWSDACEESGNAGIMSGCEILDIMPDEIDPAATRAADKLVAMLEAFHGMPIASIYSNAMQTWIDDGKSGDRPFNPEIFGHYAAMDAMGHGVGLLDCFGDTVSNFVNVPYLEFSYAHLDKEYFGQ